MTMRKISMFKKNLLLSLFVFTVLVTGCNNDNNPVPVVPDLSPKITAINPTSFPRGADHVTMTVTGTNLSDANAAWTGDGTTVFDVKSVSATSVTIEFSVQ